MYETCKSCSARFFCVESTRNLNRGKWNKLFIDNNLRPSCSTNALLFGDSWTIHIHMVPTERYKVLKTLVACLHDVVHVLDHPHIKRLSYTSQGRFSRLTQAFPSWLRSIERIMHVRSTGCQPIADCPQALQFVRQWGQIHVPVISRFANDSLTR